MLSRWQSTIVDERGNVQPLANLTVRNESDQSLAKLWASPGTTQPLPDGMVQADGNGYAFFYARGGLYRITSVALGIDWRHVQIGAALVSIGDYAAGLEITARNQIFWRDGELYRAGAALELPYTTTGDWGDEEGLFVAVGDHALRQKLTNPQGSAFVGWGSVAVDSVYALSSISPENRRDDLVYVVRGFHPDSKVGGGAFFYDTEVNRSAHNGGTVISPTVPSVTSQPGGSLSERTLSYLEGNGDTEPNGFGCFVRILNGFINAEDFGVFDSDVEVQGAALNVALSAAAEQNVALKTASALNVETDVSIVVPVEGIVDAPQLRIRERNWGAVNEPIVMALSGTTIKGVTVVGSTAEMAVSARGSSNVTVSDCDISGALIGIDFRHVNISTNIFIKNNDINVKVFGIIFNNSEDCTIIENRITSESPNAGGCIESVTGPSSRIKIVRNTLTETRVGVNLLDATRCLVTENYTNGFTGLQFRNTSHCVVSNNVVEDAKDLGINFDRVNKHNVVVGNTIKNCGQAGIGLTEDVGEPSLPTENSYFTITGNTVTDSTILPSFPTITGAGIIAITNGHYNTISANTFYGNERFGIKISSGITNTIIDGNQCIGNEIGILVENDDSVISSNVVRNNSIAGIHITRNNSIISGNRASNNGIGIQLSDQSQNCLSVGNMSLNNATSNYSNIQGLSGCKGRGNHGIEDFG